MKFRLKAASGPLTGQTFDLGVDITHIGRDASMDVVIDALDDQHAKISSQAGGLIIEPIGASAVFVNGEAVTHPKALASGDEIRLGELRLVLQAPGLKPQRILHTTKTKKPFPWARLGVAVVVVAAGVLAYVYWQHPEWLQSLIPTSAINNEQ